MEPIVAVLRIDEFVLGSNPAPRTWPTGTVVKIFPRYDDRGNPIFARRGERNCRNAHLRSEANAAASGNFNLHAHHPGRRQLAIWPLYSCAKLLGAPVRQRERHLFHAAHSPSNNAGETARTGVRFVILAEPITVGGPGDVVLKPNITYGGSSDHSCGPKYISAAVGGVVALDWDTEKYPNTLKNDNTNLKIAYAGSPAYIKMTINPAMAQQTAATGSMRLTGSLLFCSSGLYCDGHWNVFSPQLNMRLRLRLRLVGRRLTPNGQRLRPPRELGTPTETPPET